MSKYNKKELALKSVFLWIVYFMNILNDRSCLMNYKYEQFYFYLFIEKFRFLKDIN